MNGWTVGTAYCPSITRLDGVDPPTCFGPFAVLGLAVTVDGHDHRWVGDDFVPVSAEEPFAAAVSTRPAGFPFPNHVSNSVLLRTPCEQFRQTWLASGHTHKVARSSDRRYHLANKFFFLNIVEHDLIIGFPQPGSTLWRNRQPVHIENSIQR